MQESARVERISFACAGSLTASEAIIAIAEDSTTDVAGKVTAQLLVSGSGAWLTAFLPTQIAVEHVSGYVMIKGRLGG